MTLRVYVKCVDSVTHAADFEAQARNPADGEATVVLPEQTVGPDSGALLEQ